MTVPVPQHVRLRADPKVLRVSIRRARSGKLQWVVKITIRGKMSESLAGYGATPQEAVENALKIAEAGRLPGLNLSLENACKHPQWREP